MKEERKEAVTPTTLVLVAILSACLTIFWAVFTIFLSGMMSGLTYCTQNVSNLIPTIGVELLGGPFITFLFVMVFMRVPALKRHLTTTNLVYLYVTTLGVSYFANTALPWHCQAGIIIGSASDPTNYYGTYMPNFAVYSKDIATKLIEGYGSIGAIPWITVFPGILWRFLLVALFSGISLGVANIFRAQWMDVERLPFPQVMLAHSVLENIGNIEKPGWYMRKPFLMGILVGFILGIPISGAALFPWFPDIFGYRSNTCGFGSQYLAPPDIPWNLGLNKHPPMYALLLLAPLNILFSILIYTFIFEASLFIAYYGFGAYTGYLSQGFCGRSWCGSNSPYLAPPLYYNVIVSGAMLGLFVMIIFSQRNHIMETLKVAFRGAHTEQEKLEPMSYRTSWAILIVSYILMMIFFIFTGFSPWVSLTLPLVGIITWLTLAQLWGQIGFGPCPCYSITPLTTRMLIWPTAVAPTNVTSTDIALVPTVASEYIGHQTISGWGGSMYTFMASYKMASLTGVNPRNLVKVTVTCLLISMLVTWIAQVAVMGSVGAARFMGGFNPAVYPTGLGWAWWTLWFTPTSLPITQVTSWLIIGFVFMIVMKFLYNRFLWLPIDPIGAIVAWEECSGGLDGIWVAVLAAWVIKSIVLRVGGSKLYESKIVPFVGGFMLGDALEVFLAALTSYVLVLTGL